MEHESRKRKAEEMEEDWVGKSAAMRDQHPISDRFRTKIQSYFQSGRFSDLTIRLPDGGEIKAHRALVCGLSDVFENACSSNFCEAKTGVIEITHEDSEAVELMINWMYYGDTHQRRGQGTRAHCVLPPPLDRSRLLPSPCP
ncbi:hypothetical protein IWZ00DRAFT_72079 [Phyllosticta capitalensis]